MNVVGYVLLRGGVVVGNWRRGCVMRVLRDVKNTAYIRMHMYELVGRNLL